MSVISEILSQLREENRLRAIPAPTDENFLDLSSNDYLGLGNRFAEFTEEFNRRFHDASFSSSASRLLSGRQKYHLELEDFLESLYGKKALLFNSGYHANVGCIGALTLPSTLFVCDKLIHASVIDGLKISSAQFLRFPHNDIEKLESILRKESSGFNRIIVVVESIYSMDGDEAPLRNIIELKRKYPSMLIYVDEAHAFGVKGKRGLGLCEEYGIINETDLIIGTFGKAAASVGAFAIVSDELKKLLINTSRPFIFSTALPPVNVAWSLLMTEKIIDMGEERLHLEQLSQFFADRLEQLQTAGKSSYQKIGNQVSTTTPSYIKRTVEHSQIIPFLTGDAKRAIEIATLLRKEGIIALPIRRPTVPPGGERIRFSLSAAMTFSQLAEVADIMERILI